MPYPVAAIDLLLNCICVACSVQEHFRLDTVKHFSEKVDSEAAVLWHVNFPTICTMYGMLDFTRLHVIPCCIDWIDPENRQEQNSHHLTFAMDSDGRWLSLLKKVA